MSRPVLVKGSARVPHFSIMPASELCVGCATFIDPANPHRIVWDEKTEKWWRQCPECWSSRESYG